MDRLVVGFDDIEVEGEWGRWKYGYDGVNWVWGDIEEKLLL